MNYWRVTKYDPRQRDRTGAFRGAEWTAVTDVGSVVGGKLVTPAAYAHAEDAYVSAVLAFIAEGGRSLTVVLSQLEAPDCDQHEIEKLGVPPVKLDPRTLTKGAPVQPELVADIVRLTLREVIWTELACGTALLIRFGYDYYMYVASAGPCESAIKVACSRGLFVEPIERLPT
jgi:hypothetical protein